MKSIAVIYWSGTGNTQQMAVAVAEGAKAEGIEVILKEVSSATKEDIIKADAVALGCPSMGSEVLEESEMEPFVEAIEVDSLTGKPLALFGSYDWGEGQWMDDWQERMSDHGAKLAADGLIIHMTPDDEGLKLCSELGSKLAASI